MSYLFNYPGTGTQAAGVMPGVPGTGVDEIMDQVSGEIERELGRAVCTFW